MLCNKRSHLNEEITQIREEIKKIQIEKAIEEINLRGGSLKG